MTAIRLLASLDGWDGLLPAVLLADAAGRRPALVALAARALGLDPAFVAVTHREGEAPRLVRPAEAALHLSSASRDGLAALAAARVPVGVDVERVDAGKPIPWNVLHPQEVGDLCRSLDPAADFAALWAVKEAYLKALGTGLSRDPASFAARLGPRPIVEDPGGPDAEAAVVRHDAAAGRFAVALVLVDRA